MSGRVDLQHFREQLEQDLKSIEFSVEMKRRVLRKAKPSIWEREIVLPLPIVAMVILLFIGLGVFIQTEYRNDYIEATYPQESQEIIVLDSGVFFENSLRKER